MQKTEAQWHKKSFHSFLVSSSDTYTNKHIPVQTRRQKSRCHRSCAGRCVGREPCSASWSWEKEAPGWDSGLLWHWRAAGKPPLTWPGPSDGSLAHIWCTETVCWGHKLQLNSPVKTQMHTCWDKRRSTVPQDTLFKVKEFNAAWQFFLPICSRNCSEL